MAWAKLLFFRDRGPTEIGGFAVTDAEDLLYVRDFVTIEQSVSACSVEFDDAAVADFFEEQVDAGRRPEQFARLWLHTHPGSSPEPSATDEETFERVFGRCEWAVMFILARTGKTSARLRFNVGPGGQLLVPVQVDYTQPFEASDQETWQAEYDANIKPEAGWEELAPVGADADICFPEYTLADLAEMDPAERQYVLDELTLCQEGE
jgi:proteasome lid subunit RPN8/RPN11